MELVKLFVLVLNEVVLVLLLDLVHETVSSSTSTGETPEYEHDQEFAGKTGFSASK